MQWLPGVGLDRVVGGDVGGCLAVISSSFCCMALQLVLE